MQYDEDHIADNPAADDAIDRILIVVGAHLRAEVADRPLAYRLREQILRWQDQLPEDVAPFEPIVCSDLWYLNNDDLMEQPTITIGGAGVNATTAFLTPRIPMAFMIQDTLQVQMDVEFSTHQVCIWGVNHAATASAVDLFAERYLDGYLLSAHDLRPEDLEPASEA